MSDSNSPYISKIKAITTIIKCKTARYYRHRLSRSICRITGNVAPISTNNMESFFPILCCYTVFNGKVIKHIAKKT